LNTKHDKQADQADEHKRSNCRTDGAFKERHGQDALFVPNARADVGTKNIQTLSGVSLIFERQARAGKGTREARSLLATSPMRCGGMAAWENVATMLMRLRLR
jgi:hypothetical protein